MGFVLGLLLGAIGALLYAPKPGDNTREELQLRADELKKRADDLQRIAQKIADDVSVKGREILEDAKKQWESSGPGTGRSGGTTGGTAAKS
jgi:gas vesicle protein